MSTDLQKYSTENQLDTIRRYAERRGYTIVRVFEDSGRSGLRIDNRDGLQSHMLEVQSGNANFQAILVYDVSRWGRFQDADEGAYHEHVCSRAGSLYRHRFGSLLRAYSLIGYAPDRDYRYIEINRHIRQSHPKLMEEVVAGLESAGASV